MQWTIEIAVCSPSIYERFVFNRCNQKPDQSVLEYILKLHKLASSCNFKTFLIKTLKDRFIYGLRSENIQRRENCWQTSSWHFRVLVKQYHKLIFLLNYLDKLIELKILFLKKVNLKVNNVILIINILE